MLIIYLLVSLLISWLGQVGSQRVMEDGSILQVQSLLCSVCQRCCCSVLITFLYKMVKQLLLVLLFVALACVTFGQFGGSTAGGYTPINLDTADEDTLQDLDTTSAFAIGEINKQVEGGMMESDEDLPTVPLELVEILSAGSQVVQGMKYKMALNTTDAMEDVFVYNVEVVYIPWMGDLTLESVELDS
eukprot:TRINITY_DN1983_c4_g1_i1.p1 TRINITY_DN1983_c4_g1~~TRINITY_DN1983_c4_g1_i1.p1  ORF type:complete len:188 (-),score=24.83 TRINITY_DN1983_c4_g1_i1:399-962(-)